MSRQNGKPFLPFFCECGVETDLTWVTWVGVQRILCPHMNQKEDRLNMVEPAETHNLTSLICSCCVHEAITAVEVSKGRNLNNILATCSQTNW